MPKRCPRFAWVVLVVGVVVVGLSLVPGASDDDATSGVDLSVADDGPVVVRVREPRGAGRVLIRQGGTIQSDAAAAAADDPTAASSPDKHKDNENRDEYEDENQDVDANEKQRGRNNKARASRKGGPRGDGNNGGDDDGAEEEGGEEGDEDGAANENEEGSDQGPSSHVEALDSNTRLQDRSHLVVSLWRQDKVTTSAKAAWIVWMRQVSLYADVWLVVTECESTDITRRGMKEAKLPNTMIDNTLCLPASLLRDIGDQDEGLPHDDFVLWQFVVQRIRQTRAEYDFVTAVHPFTYVNPRRVAAMLDSLVHTPPSNHLYLGLPSVGPQKLRDALSLPKPFCHRMMYTVSAGLLSAIGNNIADCLQAAKTQMSEAEFGRCVQAFAGVECTKYDVGKMYNAAFVIGAGGEVERLQKNVLFASSPRSVHFDAMAVYPLHKTTYLYRFGKQQAYYLRPLQPLPPPERAPDSASASLARFYPRARTEVLSSCVHSPERQKQVSGLTLPECRPPKALSSWFGWPKKAFIPTIKKNKRKHISTLGELEISGLRVPIKVGGGNADSKTPAEMAKTYLATIKAIITVAQRRKMTQVLIVDDEAVLHCDFKARFKQMLQDQRCGGHLQTAWQGGALVLGAQQVRGTAPLASSAADKDDLCLNFDASVTGVFAGVFHRATFDTLLTWMAENEKKAQPESFDQAILNLTDSGYIVRVAQPPLIVLDTAEQNLIHPVVMMGGDQQQQQRLPSSSSQQRNSKGNNKAQAAVAEVAQNNRPWSSSEYCDYVQFM